MIKVLCVGKIKEKFLKDAIDEYSKRISKYTKFSIIEVNDYNLYDDATNKEKEAKELEKYIDKRDYIICLSIDGEQINSVELSKKIDGIFNNYSNITFIIGGSNGFADSIVNICNYKLSFSKLTFPHQLFRVMLLEQIYRSFKIINNETYHK